MSMQVSVLRDLRTKLDSKLTRLSVELASEPDHLKQLDIIKSIDAILNVCEHVTRIEVQTWNFK